MTYFKCFSFKTDGKIIRGCTKETSLLAYGCYHSKKGSKTKTCRCSTDLCNGIINKHALNEDVPQKITDTCKTPPVKNFIKNTGSKIIYSNFYLLITILLIQYLYKK